MGSGLFPPGCRVAGPAHYAVVQSSGTGLSPHTLPASFRANPSNQIFSNSPSEMQWTTRASTDVFAGRSSRRTLVPLWTGRGERTAHPRRLARITTHGCENCSRGSMLVRVIGISQGIRVPPRATSLCGEEFSSAVPNTVWQNLAGDLSPGVFCSGFVTQFSCCAGLSSMRNSTPTGRN